MLTRGTPKAGLPFFTPIKTLPEARRLILKINHPDGDLVTPDFIDKVGNKDTFVQTTRKARWISLYCIKFA